MINRWLGSGNRFILDRVGEAETGSGGDQPDRGIAGRNSSRTMRRAWVLPTRSFTWVAGPTGGRRLVPFPGFGFCFWFWFGPHRTDRFRHASENAIPMAVGNDTAGVAR